MKALPPSPRAIDPAVLAAASAAADALDALALAEATAKDPKHYERLGQVAKMAQAVRQRYATRVAQIAPPQGGDPIFAPLPGFHEDDGTGNNYIQAGEYAAPLYDEGDNYGGVMAPLRIGAGGGVGDMADLLRESLMSAQKMQDKAKEPRKLSVEDQLDNLLGSQAALKKAGLKEEADGLIPRIKRLAQEVAGIHPVAVLPIGSVQNVSPPGSIDAAVQPNNSEGVVSPYHHGG